MSNIESEVLELDHLDALIPDGLLELYEVLEFLEHPDVPSFPEPMMASGLMTVSLPLGFISRQQWGARSWTSRTSIQKTARGNTGHWEGPGQGLYDHSSCATKVRGIQAYHMSKGWADIAYSSIICRHGAIFEGRWYGYRTAANGTNTGNDRSYAHCVLIGVGDSLPMEAKKGLRNAFLHFEARGSGTSRWDHNDWKATQCPGTDIERFIKVDNLFVPEAPAPDPAPTLTLIDSMEIDMKLETYSLSIGTTPSGQAFAGCGWVRVPFERSQIKGFTGPGLRPAADGRYDTADVGFAHDSYDNNPGTIVSVEGWAPGWPAIVEITVAVP